MNELEILPCLNIETLNCTQKYGHRYALSYHLERCGQERVISAVFLLFFYTNWRHISSWLILHEVLKAYIFWNHALNNSFLFFSVGSTTMEMLEMRIFSYRCGGSRTLSHMRAPEVKRKGRSVVVIFVFFFFFEVMKICLFFKILYEMNLEAVFLKY